MTVSPFPRPHSPTLVLLPDQINSFFPVSALSKNYFLQKKNARRPFMLLLHSFFSSFACIFFYSALVDFKKINTIFTDRKQNNLAFTNKCFHIKFITFFPHYWFFFYITKIYNFAKKNLQIKKRTFFCQIIEKNILLFW